MRTSRRLLKQVRRALLVALLFTAGINILMLATPLYTLQIFDTVVPAGSIETLVALTAMAAGALVAMALVEICRDRVLLRAGLWLDHVLGQHVLQNGLVLDMKPAELRAHAAALANVRNVLVSGGLGPLFDLPWVPVFLVILWLLSPGMGVFAAAICALLLMAAVLNEIAASGASREAQAARERAEQWWLQVTRNAHLTGALGLSVGAASQWERFDRAHVASAYTAGKRSSAVKAVVRAVRVAGQIGCYGLGAWLVIGGELAPGALIAAVIILSRMMSPLEQLVTGLAGLRSAITAYRRLAAMPADATAVVVDDPTERPGGRVELSDVTFYHDGRNTPALRNVNLTLEPGESIGIVGANGSGKSTLAAVLAGAVAPTSGSADLDGVAVHKWQRRSGLPAIGYLPDEPALVAGTVHDNIARFRPAAAAGVARSAIRAGVHDIITGLQNGYDTLIGPEGAGLALRERRAVAWARALHGGPAIVVLDEPEIGLDGEGIKRLVATLGQLKSDGIGFAVATQDPRLLAVADKLIVLAGGTVQAVGPRDQVLASLAQSVRQPDQREAAGDRRQVAASSLRKAG